MPRQLKTPELATTANFIVYLLCMDIGIADPLSSQARVICAKTAAAKGMIDLAEDDDALTDKGRAYVEALKAVPDPRAIWVVGDQRIEL